MSLKAGLLPPHGTRAQRDARLKPGRRPVYKTRHTQVAVHALKSLRQGKRHSIGTFEG
jgi:hypothetical protein